MTQKDILSEAKQKCLSILSSAVICHKKMKQDSTDSVFLAGKIAAYLGAFRSMAKVLGIPYETTTVVEDLEKAIDEVRKKPIEPIEPKVHILTVDKVIHMEEPKIPLHEQTDLPNHKLILLGEIKRALKYKGHTEQSAHIRATAVYKKPGKLAELIEMASAL